MPRITKRAVDALCPAERERIVWDDDIKGFGVRVHPTGRKVYIVKYRHEGRSVKVTIGPHGPVTPAAARARAAEIVTLAKTGRDVSGKTLGQKSSATMADLCGRFMKEYAPGHLKPSTARLYRKIIENRILPRLGKRRVGDIGKNDVAALHHEMRDVPGHANRTPSVLSRMLTGCRSGEIMSLRWEYVDLELGELRLPESKTGSKVVHLGEPAVAVLQGIPRREGDPWVLPGAKQGSHIAYLHDSWTRILERAGIENLRIHDYGTASPAAGCWSGRACR